MTRTLHEVRRRWGPVDLLDRLYTRRLLRLATGHAARRGQPMAVYANDVIGIDINLHGVYERDELDLLFGLLAPLKAVFAGGIALDIGANVGNHTLWLARRFRLVHAFEPHPLTHELLDFNTRRLTNVERHALALGEQAGSAPLVVDSINMGGSTLAYGGRETQQSVPVRVERLDDLVDRGALDLHGLCFVKIDVEGHEAAALRGALNTLQREQPLLVFEQHAREFHDGSTPCIELLRALGYAFCWQRPQRWWPTWVGRRLQELLRSIRGRTQAIETGAQVPPVHHSMLVAVPPRFQDALGLDAERSGARR
jgi:FkbM family methyltransferase